MPFYVVSDEEFDERESFVTVEAAVENAKQLAQEEGETFYVLQPVAEIAVPKVEPTVKHLIGVAEEA